jgi:hypothetical protein
VRRRVEGGQQVSTQIFSWGGGGGAGPEAIYNLCLVLKIFFEK